jgi:hypothetical protein
MIDINKAKISELITYRMELKRLIKQIDKELDRREEK